MSTLLKPLPKAPTSAEDRAGVLLPLPLSGAYDYRLPAHANATRGTLVAAPLGGRDLLGVVWGCGDGAVADAKLKSVAPLPGNPRLPDKLCDFIDWVARYTLSPPGIVLALALRAPAAFEAEIPRIAFRLNPDVGVKRTPSRVRVLEIAGDGLARTPAALAQEADASTAVVRGLIQAGALQDVALPEFPPLGIPDPAFTQPVLNREQESAARALAGDVAAQAFAVTLLDGVTGSGKTETYFEAIAEALRRGKQSLVLLPEIALTVQFLDRFAARFGVRPAEWHSDLSQKERKRIYRAVMNGEARVLVGARSSLFLPFKELGLIVVDEEHEQAFKQEDGVIYHARDMAVVRARIEDIPILLSSATPSLESYVNAKSGRYRLLELPRRHRDAALPDIRLIDLRETPLEPAQWLSKPLCDALTTTLAAGEQAMLFLNRRGYAPLTLCESCGHKFVCRDCSAWLVEHRYRKRLMCHLCGYETPMPDECPQCHTQGSLTACGPGVERLAEEFIARFPNVRMAIASSDTMHGPAETQAAIRAMAKREIDVLIGTQIVAKGHHFPQLTLVGIVDADLAGAEGDLRARERMFQLLHQVAGRAGRAEKPGVVLLQTRNPQDAVMQALANGTRDEFLVQEMAMRERASAPPYGRLAAIILSSADSNAVQVAGRALAKEAPPARGVAVFGPAPAFYQVLRGRTRERLLARFERAVDMQAYLNAWLARVKLPGAVRLTVDIDPVSFF